MFSLVETEGQHGVEPELYFPSSVRRRPGVQCQYVGHTAVSGKVSLHSSLLRDPLLSVVHSSF